MTEIPTQILMDRIKKRLAKLIDGITEKELATLIDVAMALKSIECEFTEINRRHEEIESRQLERKLQIVRNLDWLLHYVMDERGSSEDMEPKAMIKLYQNIGFEIDRQTEDILKILNDRKDLPHKTPYELLKGVKRNAKSVHRV